jgi:hypothetical protein
MPGKAANVVITVRQQDVLQAMSRSVTISFQLWHRARIILLGFEGRLNSEIEDIVGLGHDGVGAGSTSLNGARPGLLYVAVG